MTSPLKGRRDSLLIVSAGIVLAALLATGTRAPLRAAPRSSADGTPAAQDPLAFPKDGFTVETRTVRTSTGEKRVTLRAYRHIPYVAKPVDKDYQSLDVIVPTEVDGRAVDASKAPILFSIPVGGYMSASNAGRGAGGGRMGGPPTGAPPPGGPPGGGPPAGAPRGDPARGSRMGGQEAGRGMGGPGMGGAGRGGNVSRNTDLALAAGYVVVTPGVRGRDNKAADGTNYGKAPAAIVDLKAAIRYLRHNAGVVPGNPEWIVATGVSAGGALTALVGASGGSALYDSALKEVGAANADDRVFAAAPFCPIMDLEHADMAYEWMYGAVPARSGGLVDQELSKQLRNAFAVYQASLKIQGRDGFGALTADTYGEYLLRTYLFSSATKYLKALADERRQDYLASNPWISWSADKGATFTFTDFVTHVGRMKGLPAFDDFDLKQPEPNVFGDATTDSRHFTAFSLRHATANPNAAIDKDLQHVVNLMNPMYFIGQNDKGIARHWWIRMGSSDNHTSLTVPVNLAASLETRAKDVNTWFYWDAGHGADEDAEEFVAWIGTITGFAASR